MFSSPRFPVEFHEKKKNSQIKMKTPSTLHAVTTKLKQGEYVRLDWLKPSEKSKADRQQSKKKEGNPSWISQVKFEA